jgi:hypothetical protein
MFCVEHQMATFNFSRLIRLRLEACCSRSSQLGQNVKGSYRPQPVLQLATPIETRQDAAMTRLFLHRR